jgi:hypothetical protein
MERFNHKASPERLDKVLRIFDPLEPSPLYYLGSVPYVSFLNHPESLSRLQHLNFLAEYPEFELDPC